MERNWEIYSANPPTVKPHQHIGSAGTINSPTDIPLKICPVRGEKYPESTIHTVCFMCGSPLNSKA